MQAQTGTHASQVSLCKHLLSSFHLNFELAFPRHGARLPTDSPQESAPQFGHFFTNLTQSNTTFNFDGPLSFMNDWKYTLGSNLLTPAGSQQLYDSGVQSYYRYSALYNSTAQKHKPVVRTTSQSRMVDSATYFNLGFFGKNAANLVETEVLIESNNFNSVSTCQRHYKGRSFLTNVLPFITRHSLLVEAAPMQTTFKSANQKYNHG